MKYDEARKRVERLRFHLRKLDNAANCKGIFHKDLQALDWILDYLAEVRADDER